MLNVVVDASVLSFKAVCSIVLVHTHRMALLPYRARFVIGTDSMFSCEECRLLSGWYQLSKCFKYDGVSSFKTLKIKVRTLSVILCSTGTQQNSLRIAVTWSLFLDPTVSFAAAFYTQWMMLLTIVSGSPYSRLLFWSILYVT